MSKLDLLIESVIQENEETLFVFKIRPSAIEAGKTVIAHYVKTGSSFFNGFLYRAFLRGQLTDDEAIYLAALYLSEIKKAGVKIETESDDDFEKFDEEIS